MGGLGSGPWLGKSTSMVVEKCLDISVKAFCREGILKQEYADGSISWRGDFPSSVGFRLDTSEDGTKKIYLQWSQRKHKETIRETVWLQTTHPYFGGVRWWFTCPGCGKRVAFLYLPPGHSLFLCRGCHGLSYYSQRLGPHDRTLFIARNMRQKLDGSESLSEPFPFKPEGMHWATYERVRWKYMELLKRLSEYMSFWI